MFNFKLKFWTLSTRELQDVLSFIVTKKTVAELEEEQEIVNARLELAYESGRNVATGNNIRDLRIQNGLIRAAMYAKKEQ